MTRNKQPVSVLVVIHTAPLTASGPTHDVKVLLLERADHPGFWQSVTGSRDGEESLTDTAIREVHEETGLDARRYLLSDWKSQNVYAILPVSRTTPNMCSICNFPIRLISNLRRASI
jgi:dATP pyrophosphohydrolase